MCRTRSSSDAGSWNGPRADPGSEFYVPNPARRAAIVESRDEYRAENVFWVPPAARWPQLQAMAKQPTIGALLDEAMDAIEKENPSLKGVLPKSYARAEIDKRLLGGLVDLIGNIGFTDIDHGADDVLGRVYEYFLGKFAAAEGRGRRRVLHASVRRQAARRGHRAVPRARVRPVLRLRRDVRAVGRVRRRPRGPARRPGHLRPGVRGDDVAAGQGARAAEGVRPGRGP